MVEATANLGKEQPLQNINVMMLHTKLVMSNTERFYKLLITYLIEQQYRRSEEAQEVGMRNVQIEIKKSQDLSKN